MQQKLADVERKGGSLCVRLKEGSAFDPYIYEQIRMDETCLPPLQERKGVIRYETAGLTSLSYFLAHYHFEQEEAAKAGEPDVHRISRVSCADIQGV